MLNDRTNVAVVVVTRNRPHILQKMLHETRRQTGYNRFRVVVADDEGRFAPAAQHGLAGPVTAPDQHDVDGILALVRKDQRLVCVLGAAHRVGWPLDFHALGHRRLGREGRTQEEGALVVANVSHVRNGEALELVGLDRHSARRVTRIGAQQ